MVFENIFSKKDNNLSDVKPFVVVDVHEKNSLVASELVSLGARIKFEHLSIADYLVGNVAVERKTINDFVSSMINKRLVRQLVNLQKYDEKFLLIEGSLDNSLSSFNLSVNSNAIRGFILSVIIDFGVPVIMTRDSSDTSKFLFLLSRRVNKSKFDASFRASRSGLSINDRLSFILEGFPNVGPVKAKLLLGKFGNIKNVINASEIDLEKVIGKSAKSFLDLINRSY